jgi:hypothetical protein
MSSTLDPVKGKPPGALEQKDVRIGDKIVSYVPGDPSSVLRYQLVTPPAGDEHTVEDGRGDLLLWVLNLDTNVTTQIDTATLGLTPSHDGSRTRWAIFYDEEN